MSALDELLAELEDPDLAEKVKGMFTAQEEVMAQRQAIMDRDAKVSKEKAKLAQKFPRAMVAFEKGRLTLPDDPSDDALVAALKAKEEELEDLGVPIQGAAPSTKQTAEVDEDDPADSWGQDISSGRGDTSVHDILNDTIQLVEDGGHDRNLSVIPNVAQMNPDQRQAFLDHLSPKYPVMKAPPAYIQNLTPLGGGQNAPKANKVSSAAKRGRPAKAS
jgi:hypothetical protein